VVAALALTALPAGAAPGDKVYPHPGGGPALIVPAGSPVRFTGFDKNGVANFSGRFVLSGNFTYGCRLDCDTVPIDPNALELNLLPDPDLAKRLPHWDGRGNEMVVEVDRISGLRAKVASPDQIAKILSGKIQEVRGRIAIVVDHYVADFGCDYSPYYAARFVSVAKPAKLAQIEINGDFGCA
jgi:hypothetical protein